MNQARVQYMAVRLAPNSTVQAMENLETAWAEILSDYPFEFKFVEEDFDFVYRREQRMVDLLEAFAVMAVLIACPGFIPGYHLLPPNSEQKR